MILEPEVKKDIAHIYYGVKNLEDIEGKCSVGLQEEELRKRRNGNTV